MDIQLSRHAQITIQECKIREEGVDQTLEFPTWTETKGEDEIHYLRSISEYGGRILRVVLNPLKTPKRIVAVFFDRRLRRSP